MSDMTAEQLAQRCFDLNLVDERTLQQAWTELGVGNDDVTAFKNLLLRKELLTNYQLDSVIRGERSGYFYGHYKVLYQIGSGTFARVFRAVNMQDHQIIAVKVLRKRFSDDAAKREQFAREAQLGQALRHPNIVSIYDVATDKHTAFMVMEFVEGQTLREFLKIRKKFDAPDAIKLMIDIATGMHYAHGKGVSHRDLKGSNVLVSSAGRAKLVDFGLAGADTSLADEGLADVENPRTIDYAALEKATGVRHDDVRSDVYFMGCIFYNMLGGAPALTETRDRVQRLDKNRFFGVKPLNELAPEVPGNVVAIVNKAMNLNPKARYQTPGEMLADLKIVQKAPGANPVVAGADPSAVLKQRPVMVVESNPQMQDTLREQLKKNGYRALVTSDPDRVLNTFD